jgi:hypothetical protein
MSGSEIALIAGLAAGAYLAFRVQRWIQRWQDRAPPAVGLAVVALVIGSAILARRGLLPYEVAIPIMLIAIGGELIWARTRYSGSPSLQRWEHAWNEIARLSKSDPAAADRILLETEEADRAELESLRALAAIDRTAARRFRAGVLQELRRLRRLETSAKRVRQALRSSAETPLDSSLRRQREQRETDLRWVEGILGSGGAT